VPWADAVVPRFLSLPACGLFVSIIYREDQANRLASTHSPRSRSGSGDPSDQIERQTDKEARIEEAQRAR
jgi:hypothetical protein